MEIDQLPTIAEAAQLAARRPQSGGWRRGERGVNAGARFGIVPV
jgi:hypothetical protein